MSQKIPFLSCGKCGMSFAPKQPRNVPFATRCLKTHRMNCTGNHGIIEKSYSITEESGKHVVYRTWQRKQKKI